MFTHPVADVLHFVAPFGQFDDVVVIQPERDFDDETAQESIAEQNCEDEECELEGGKKDACYLGYEDCY